MFRNTSTIEGMRPYVARALGDDDLRKNVVRALSAAHKVYGELGGKNPAQAASSFVNDRDVREHLDSALENLSEASDRLKGVHRRKSSMSWILFGALAVLVLFNPITGGDTRRWIKDRLVGSDEEFDYGA